MRRVILSAFFMLISTGTFAAEVAVSNIKYIAPWPEHIDVTMEAEYVDESDCQNTNTIYRIDLSEGQSAQAKLSVLLSAFMAEKKVGLVVSGCVGNKPKILGIRMYK